MHIKRLELRGFKSFADKTELSLANGITAVVGPNGSGKSNLADAIKWVLGEQSVKALRGARMDELIFAGTKTRRGLGLAEVSLIFDNESGRFPLAFSEVAVTRRVFKSGESEYYLNQNKCRLRDIHDIFLDTGIGKDAYSFIGQGRIDELLSARPEERRAIFEEVAGIAKYKARKRETENKLRDTEAALTRINDLLAELENEQEPLNIEAVRAEEYLRLQSELSSVERDLLLYELNMAERRLERDRKQQAGLQDQSQAQQAELIRLETVEESLRLQSVSLQQELESNNQNLLAAIREQDRLTGEARILVGRQENREEQVRLLQTRKVEMQRNMEAVTAAEQEGAAALAVIRQARSDGEERSVACRSELEQLSHTKYDADLQQVESVLQQEMARQSQAVLNRQLWQERVVTLQSESKAEQDKQQVLALRAQELQQAVAERTLQQEAAAAEVQRLLSKVESLAAVRNREAQELAELQQQQSSLAQELAVVRSRTALLHEVVDGLEGYQRGVRGLLQAKRQQEASLQGITGVMGDLLQVESEYSVALEAALGGSIQFLITETEADAQRGIEWLKHRQMGRATFLPLSVVRPRQARPVDLEAARQEGAIGFAADLVQHDPAIKNAVGHLLGHILLVETLPQALAIARRTRHQVRMVTLEGDVLMPGGSLSGGSRHRQGTSLLGRASELQQLNATQSELEQQLSQLDLIIAQKREEVQGRIGELAIQEPVLQTKQEELRQLLAQLAAAAQADKEHQNRLAELVIKQDELAQRLTTAQAALTRANDELLQAQQEVERQEKTLTQWREQVSEQLQQREALAAKLHQAELTLAGLREQESSRERELTTIRQRLTEMRESLGNILLEETSQSEQLRKISEELTTLEGKVEAQSREVSICQECLEQARAKIETANQTLASNREAVKQARAELGEINQQLYNVELRLSRLEGDHESMVKRLQRDFSITDREGLHSTLPSRAQGETMREQLQEQLLQLGPVRVSAVEELARLHERIDFLRHQQGDVLESRHSLEALIHEIDQIMSKRFVDSFAEIRRAFRRVFQELFGGGEAELRLSDLDNPLESGIEIMAQPPGKNLQNIDLLSGGEKALTAIALLCATLEVKPTPFCLLDEIDASLDDVNTRRFMQVIARLAKDTQFILITHSKETMLAVDTLYGVTMQEQGISQLLTVELSDNEAQKGSVNRA